MSLKTKLKKLIGRWLEKLLSPATESIAPAAESFNDGLGNPAAGVSNQSAAPGVGDAVDYSLLGFRWGGFDGAGAKPADGCRIGSLKVAGGGLSYKWEDGGCESLGASSKADYGHTLACLFCRIGGKWVGGKFDWISTSRTTRSIENVFAGYNGWDPDAVSKADAFAFVIVSSDGRRRSNVIAQGGAR